MSTETYFTAYALAAPDIATAYSESSWAALLAGDLDAALAMPSKYIEMKTGKEVGRREAERFWGATASARRPSPVEEMNAISASVYRAGPWARTRS